MPSPFDKVVEKVPVKFTRRQGDVVYEGGNNTLLIMGTDRPGGPATGLGHSGAKGNGKGTGTIHLVAGRKTADPDFAQDAAFIYISQKTDADDNLGTKNIEQGSTAKPAIIAKSTDLRLGASENIKIYIDDADKKKYLFLGGDKAVLSMTEKTVLTLTSNNATLKVAGDAATVTIQIKSDGTVSIDAPTSVTVTTKTLAVDGNLTVSGQATIVGLTSAGAITATGVIKAPGMNMSDTGKTIFTGDVEVNGTTKLGGIDFKTHTHKVPAVKGGPDTVSTSGTF
jgi:hypothetical protein